MKKSKILAALVVGAMIGSISTGVTPVKAENVTIDGTGSSGNTWGYGHTRSDNTILYTSPTDVTAEDGATYSHYVGDNLEDLIDTVTLTGGEFKTHHSAQNGKLTATGGTLNVAAGELHINTGSSIADAVTLAVAGTLDVNGGTVTLNSGDTITGAITATAGTLNINGAGSLTLSNAASSITENSNVVLGSAEANPADDTAGTLVLSNASDNQAKVTTEGTNANSKLTVQGADTSNPEHPVNTTLTLSDGSDIKLGTVTVGDNIDGQHYANVLTMEGDENGSKIASAVTMVINEGAKVDMAGDKAELALGATDTWAGKIEVTGDDAKLTLSGRTDTTTEAKTYNQSAGTLTIDNGGTLNLATDDSAITVDSAVVLGEATGNTAGHLVFNNNSANAAKITTVGASTDSTLTVQGADISDPEHPVNTTLTLSDGSNIAKGTITVGDGTNANELSLTGNTNGSTIASAVTMVIDEGAKVDIYGKSDLTIDEYDTWNGEIALTSGTLEINNKAIVTNGTVKYTQTGGTLTIDNGGSLELATDASVISGGNVVLGEDATDTIGTLIISNTSDENAAQVTNEGDGESVLTVTNGSTLNLTGDSAITSAVDLNVVGGSTLKISSTKATTDGVVMDGTDTWAGTVNLNGGTLTILGDNDKTTGILTAGTGDLVIGDGTVLGAGTLNVNNANDTIAANVAVTIAANSTLAQTAGNAVLNTGDTWNGAVTLGGGNLEINALGVETTAAKTYNQTAGTLTIDNGGSLKLATNDSSITTANSKVVLGSLGVLPDDPADDTAGTLILSNGTANQAKVTTTGTNANSKLTVDGANTKLTLSDGSDIEVGTVTVGDGTNANELIMTGATNGSKIAKAVTMVINEGAKVDMSGAKADLTINTGDTWNGQINQTNGTLTVLNDNYTKTTGYLTSNGGNIVIGDTVTPVAGTLILNNANDAIAQATKVTINEDSTLSMTNGNVILDNVAATADTWSGAIEVTGANAKLTLSGRDDVTAPTTDKKTYTQTNGTLTIDNGGSLNLATAASSITTANSKVVLGSAEADPADDTAGTLIFGNASDNQAKITTAGTNTNSVLTVQGADLTDPENPVNTKLTLADGSDIEVGTVTVGDNIDGKHYANVLTMAGDTNGSKIAKAVTMVINQGAKVDMTGAKADLTINHGDTWNGQINQTNGTLTVLNDNYTKTTGYLTSNGGNIVIGDTVTPVAGTLILNNANDAIAQATKVTINEDSTLSMTNGNVILDSVAASADTWAGAISLTGDDANLSLSGRTDATTAKKTYNQTAGTLTIDNGGSLKLATNDSSITTANSKVVLGSLGVLPDDPADDTAGTLILSNGTANQAKVTTTGTNANSKLTVDGANTKLTLSDGSDIEVGTVTVGDGTNANELIMTGDTNGSKIAKAVTMVINQGAKVDMTGAKADLTINHGDTWNGQINQTNGTLTVFDADYTKDTGYLTSNGGNIVIGDGTVPGAGTLILNNANDAITAATKVTIKENSTLSMTNGNVILDNVAATADTWSGAIEVTGANAKLTLSGRDDTTDATQTYTQTNGTLTINKGGSLNLATNASSITANSNVVLGSLGADAENPADDTAGTLIFGNASDNQAKITTAGTNTDSKLTVQGADLTDPENPVNTTLTLADGSDIEVGTVTVGDNIDGQHYANVLTMAGDTNGSKIAKAVTMVINQGAKVDMTASDLADLTINSGDTWNGQIDQTKGTLTVFDADYTKATGYLTSNGGNIVIGDGTVPGAGTLKLNNALDAITETTAVTINAGSKLNQSAGNVVLNAGNDDWAGEIALSGTGNLTLKDFSGADKVVTDGTIKYNQTGGNATLNNTDLELAYNATAANTSSVTDGSIALTNGSTLTITNELATNSAAVTMADANETLNILSGSTMTLDNFGAVQTNIAAGAINIGDAADNTDHSVLAVASGTIANNAVLTLNEGSALNITGAMSSDETAPGAGDEIVTAITLGADDTWNGDINLSNASGGAADDNIITLTLDGVDVTTGEDPTFDNTGALPYYSQSGGTLALTGSTLSMGDSSLITGGNIIVDRDSVYNSLSNGFVVDNLTTAGLINGINDDYENYVVNTSLNVGDVVHGTNNADFTTDLYARSNSNKNYDTYGSDGADITALVDTDGDGKEDGILNVSDWALHGDIYGGDAPIDEHIAINNLFKGNVDAALYDINFTSVDKEVLTPIGWYRLNSVGGGNYSFDLTRYNPAAFRGQISTLAQYQNQLIIDDILFNHTMVDQGFKGNDYIVSNPNRLASASDLYPPYQYSRKDGGVWVKTYGTFENLNMSQGLHVGNNAYGTLIGVDFGLKELKRGWQFMPTVYIGYNGAHQYWDGNGAYQNGGQLGVMGTWYKDNFILGALAYGGIYGNDMNVMGRDDNTFNYFAGGSAKAAYNWNFAKNWSLQPNLMVAYNYFGEQHWHTDFGQMSMMSGMLHGINIAPGVNLIWEKDTFSIYGTLQYMYNVNQSIGGHAGNVNLPAVRMDRGYLQYGIGANKKFSDRFSGFFQAVIRNVGRTGIGLQMGFQWQLGKGGSDKTKKGNVTPKIKKADVNLKGNKIQ